MKAGTKNVKKISKVKDAKKGRGARNAQVARKAPIVKRIQAVKIKRVTPKMDQFLGTDLFTADLVLHHGKIATFDRSNKFVEAIAAKNGKILTLGSNDSILQFVGRNTKLIDLKGRTMIPGLIDSHVHPDMHAMFRYKWRDVSWPGVHSVDDCIKLIRKEARSTPPQDWILGFRYDDQKVGGYPSIKDLDEAANGLPVLIMRTDGHIGIANHAAFELCGVDKNTPNPAFGQFDRDPHTGELTGVVRETATHMLQEKVEQSYTLDELVTAFPLVLEEYLRYGITSIHNSTTTSNGLRAYQILRQAGKLPIRVGVIISGWEKGFPEACMEAGIRTGLGDEWIRIIGVEWIPDCSTSGRTAAYYEPYVGKPVVGEPTPNYGVLNAFPFESLEDLKALAIRCHKAGLRICMDGLGDHGIDWVLDVFEAALKEHPVADHRMRIEHCCFVTPKILKRIKRVGVIDSSATGFMYDLGDAYISARGKKNMKWMFPHRSLIDAGIVAPGHSDDFVTHINPMRAIYSLVNRKTDSGQAFGPEQAISVEEALRCYTMHAAYAGFEEDIKGSLDKGKLADMVVLDRDIFTISKEEIKDITVDLTIIGGIVSYQR
ncbi:MAG: amidohydrolase [Deltaproteobacteria bacterium]|nr:amidohydrolase [Deltaproteobacteria bacterium]